MFPKIYIYKKKKLKTIIVFLYNIQKYFIFIIWKNEYITKKTSFFFSNNILFVYLKMLNKFKRTCLNRAYILIYIHIRHFTFLHYIQYIFYTYWQSIRSACFSCAITETNWSIIPHGIPANWCSAFWHINAFSVNLL